MIDYGLLVSIVVAFGIPSLLIHWWPLPGYDEPAGFLDVVVGPALAALVVGRVTTLVLDDPSLVGSPANLLIIRSGVEFWPGVAAAAAVVAWGERRAGLPWLTRVAGLGPLAMVGYGSYEAACVFRDGCYGPESPVGLVAPGVSEPMLPVGWLMATGVVIAAIGVRRLAGKRHAPGVVVAVGLLGVAAVRAIGSIWLPHVGDGVTRQHLTSIVVAAVAAAATGLGALQARHQTPSVTTSQPGAAVGDA